MGKTLDVEEFLSWLNETEEELKGERADELNPDRKDEGILLATENVRKYVEKMCKIDEADSERGWIPVTERLPEDERDVLLTLESTNGKPKDEIERNMVFIEKLYAGQNNIMVKLDVMARQIDAMQQNMKLLEREQMAKRRYDEMNDHLEFIRGKSNTTVVQIERLKEMLVELDGRNLDDQNQIIDEISKLLERKTVLAKDSARGKAYELLDELIVDRNGVKQSIVFEEADKRNISKKDILRAKNEMEIQTTTKGIGANSIKYWYRG